MEMLVFAICLLLYLLPAQIANKRQHRERNAILVLNVFLGWSIVGWVAALVWASTTNVDYPATDIVLEQ